MTSVSELNSGRTVTNLLIRSRSSDTLSTGCRQSDCRMVQFDVLPSSRVMHKSRTVIHIVNAPYDCCYWKRNIITEVVCVCLSESPRTEPLCRTTRPRLLEPRNIATDCPDAFWRDSPSRPSSLVGRPCRLCRLLSAGRLRGGSDLVSLFPLSRTTIFVQRLGLSVPSSVLGPSLVLRLLQRSRCHNLLDRISLRSVLR